MFSLQLFILMNSLLFSDSCRLALKAFECVSQSSYMHIYRIYLIFMGLSLFFSFIQKKMEKREMRKGHVSINPFRFNTVTHDLVV